MTKLDQFKDDLTLLLEAGFIAVNQSDEDSAKKLFKAAEVIEPKNILSNIGLGYLYLHKLELPKAIKLFKEALKQEPNNEMAKTFLGIAMTFSKSNLEEGEKILSETNKSTHDKEVKKLSNTALDFVEKFVKKAPSPAEVQKKKHK